MFGTQITLFRLLGFKVQIDLSWLLLVALVTWSLATGYFPQAHEGSSTAAYWWMAVAGAAGLFFSIVFHELSHSLVARRYDLPIKGITLFIFGGVAEMEEEPHSPKAEFYMAIAGPISSGFLAGIFYAMSTTLETKDVSPEIWGVAHYLALVNGVLAAFNLLPGFPLDGGRVLRAVLWHLKGNIRTATRIASKVGAGFGTVLIVLGVLAVFSGNFIAGAWWFLIGMFLRGAATASYKQTIFRRLLEGEPVRRFMTANPITAPPDITVRDLVDRYMFRHYHELFPVTQGSQLLGYVSTREVKAAQHDQWDTRTVREIMIPSSPENTIPPGEDAVKALMLMRRTGNSRLLVVEGERLYGIIALKDLLRLLALKMDLETDA